MSWTFLMCWRRFVWTRRGYDIFLVQGHRRGRRLRQGPLRTGLLLYWLWPWGNPRSLLPGKFSSDWRLVSSAPPAAHCCPSYWGKCQCPEPWCLKLSNESKLRETNSINHQRSWWGGKVCPLRPPDWARPGESSPWPGWTGPPGLSPWSRPWTSGLGPTHLSPAPGSGRSRDTSRTAPATWGWGSRTPPWSCIAH